MARYTVHRSDSTAGEIRKAFEKCGCLVLALGGAIDFAVCDQGRVFLVDAKSRRSRGGKVKLTRKQQDLMRSAWPIFYPTSSDEAVALVQGWRQSGDRRAGGTVGG